MKKYSLLALLACSLSSVWAAPLHRPTSFSHNNGQAVFVDFTEATYQITYDIAARSSKVTAQMKMNVLEEGYPLFDLVEDPSSVKIDGKVSTAEEIQTPSRETTLRVLGTKLKTGTHLLEIEVPLKNLVTYTDASVKSAFWVTDLNDRFYLERYIPCNLEYDNLKMTFLVEFIGRKDTQLVFANGKVTWTDENHARIDYPEYFTVNSLYFHTTPEDSVEMIQFKYLSVDGRELPVTIYTSSTRPAGRGNPRERTESPILQRFQKLTQEVLAELEQDYGAFRHQSITIYNANLSSMGLGGMEYAGATVTNLSSLSHELFHSYFARGVVPANGNAGWIDEALASWRDDGYDRQATLNGSSGMASHPFYTRKTDTDAYGFGARFMAFLDARFSAKGGLKPFMNSLLTSKLFTPITSEEFRSAMEAFYGDDLQSVFKKYVYDNKAKKEKAPTHHIHRKMGPKELESIL